MHSFLIPLLTAFQLLAAPASAVETLGAPTAASDAKTRVAQTAAVAAMPTQVAAQKLRRAQLWQKKVAIEKSALRRSYDKQLLAVDELKRARASWRRDRKLREQKAKSQKTAIALQALERRLHAQKALVASARKQLLVALNQELNQGPSAARQSEVRRMLATLSVGLRKAPRKISMPHLELDEYADPEELLEQIALIERAEAKLVSEQASLGRRAEHYARMHALKNKRRRAETLSAFDADDVRRSTGHVATSTETRTSAPGGDSDFNDAAGTPSPAPGEAPGLDLPGGDLPGTDSFEVSSVVLADVVDLRTQDALRKAHRSSSPKTKALAAKRAQGQVSERLARLYASKEKIRLHLKRIRGR